MISHTSPPLYQFPTPNGRIYHVMGESFTSRNIRSSGHLVYWEPSQETWWSSHKQTCMCVCSAVLCYILFSYCFPVLLASQRPIRIILSYARKTVCRVSSLSILICMCSWTFTNKHRVIVTRYLHGWLKMVLVDSIGWIEVSMEDYNFIACCLSYQGLSSCHRHCVSDVVT